MSTIMKRAYIKGNVGMFRNIRGDLRVLSEFRNDFKHTLGVKFANRENMRGHVGG